MWEDFDVDFGDGVAVGGEIANAEHVVHSNVVFELLRSLPLGERHRDVDDLRWQLVDAVKCEAYVYAFFHVRFGSSRKGTAADGQYFDTATLNLC